MGLLKVVSGSAWPLSGAASAGTTGLSVLSGVAMTHVGSSDIPPGSKSTGFLRQNSAGLSYVQLDAASTIFSANNRYTHHVWVRYNYDASPPANGANNRILDLNGLGVRVLVELYYRPAADGKDAGWNCLVSQTTGGGTLTRLSSQTASGAVPFIRAGRWYRLSVEYDSTAGAGQFRFYINGVLIAEIVGMTTATGPSGSPSSSFCYWSLGVTGAIVDVAGPIESDNAEDVAITPANMLYVKDSDLCVQSLPIELVNRPRGSRWSSSLAGTTLTETTYSTSGTNPLRKRVVLSGAGTCTLTSQAIGALPFNPSGWATVHFPHTYLPGASVHVFRLRNGANDATVYELEVDADNLLQGTTEIGPWDHTHRYSVLLHLHEDGAACCTLLDLTALVGSTRAWSAQLANWTPQALGAIQQATTVDSDAEVDGVWIDRWVNLMGIDSMCGAAITSLSPAAYISRNRVGVFAGYHGEDFSAIPGTAEPDRPFSNNPTTLARPGYGFDSFYADVIPGLAFTRGMRFQLIDGPSINDLTGTDDSNRASRFAIWKSRVGQFVLDAVSRGNRVHLTTCIRREQGTYTATQLREIDARNGFLRLLFQTGQRYFGSHPAIEMSDVAYAVDDHSSLFTAGDDVHFDAAGNETVGGLYRTLLTTASQQATVGSFTPADVVGAVNDDAIQSTARSNAATAAAESTAIRKLSEADQRLVEVGGLQVLKTYERGTVIELIPAKTAKQPDGNDLTDPTTQLLGGYVEEE
jgi:hypothetical protein